MNVVPSERRNVVQDLIHQHTESFLNYKAAMLPIVNSEAYSSFLSATSFWLTQVSNFCIRYLLIHLTMNMYTISYFSQ